MPSIPQRGGQKTPERLACEKSPAFKKMQRFRAGIEGRISVLFRGRGMKRCCNRADCVLRYSWAAPCSPTICCVLPTSSRNLFRARRRRHKKIPLLLVSVFPILPTPKPLTGSKTAIPHGFWPALTPKSLESQNRFCPKISHFATETN